MTARSRGPGDKMSLSSLSISLCQGWDIVERNLITRPTQKQSALQMLTGFVTSLCLVLDTLKYRNNKMKHVRWGTRFLYLGSALQLIHGRVVGWLPGSTFGGADEFSESLGHVPHCVYQNHLRRQSRCECKHNGQRMGLSLEPWGEDLTPEPLSLPPFYDSSALGEGRKKAMHAG